KYIKNRWDDEKAKLEQCFAWLSSWKNAPTHTIAGVQELYQQLLLTKVYYNRKTKSQVTEEKRRICGDSLENDVPLFADTTQLKANRIDATVIDKTSKQVTVIEMSCPWLENRESKDFEKTTKYNKLRLELTNRYPKYKINQYINIITDVLGGCSKAEVEQNAKELVG
ncbi:unnamed protein product, partial [Porites lobata]